MQRSRPLTAMMLIILFCGLILATRWVSAVPAQASTQACRSLALGTYLTTITDNVGNPSSRAIVTFHIDGAFSSIDSNQAGVPSLFNPFTGAAGTWACTGRQTLAALSLDFVLPGSEGIVGGLVRADYAATVNPETRGLGGTIVLHSFPLNGDPLADQGAFLGSFRFTGQRVGTPSP